MMWYLNKMGTIHESAILNITMHSNPVSSVHERNVEVNEDIFNYRRWQVIADTDVENIEFSKKLLTA